MLIKGFQKLTLLDYPGQVAATIFVGGCNFNCSYCYNTDLVVNSNSMRTIPEEEIFKELEKRKKMLDGVVICGGEPTIYSNLREFIEKIKKLGFLVKLDTNGSNPEMIKKLIDEKLIDYVALDIKGPKERYNEFVGKKVDVKKIQESIDILKEGRVDYEFRSTIVPTLHTKEDVIEMAKWIRGTKRYYLQNFRPEKTIDPKFEKIKPYPQEYLLKIQKAIAPFFEICQVR